MSLLRDFWDDLIHLDRLMAEGNTQRVVLIQVILVILSAIFFRLLRAVIS